MSVRFVIPEDALPTDQAFYYRPETWEELALEAPGSIVENAGSAWCIANGIVGLGFVEGED